MKIESINSIDICIISIAKLKSIVKVASVGTVFPYNEDFRKASYRKGLFQKVDGYIVTGFVKNWDENFGMSDPFLRDKPILRALLNIPCKSVLISNEMKTMLEAGKSFIVKSNAETVLTIKSEDGWRSSEMCLIDISYVSDLEDKEIMKEKSIIAFIGRGLSMQ